MSCVRVYTLLGLLLLLILVGFCVAEEVPDSVVYVQGGNPVNHGRPGWESGTYRS